MKKTILIAIEGMDWKVLNRLVDEGKLPTIESLLDSGTSGNLRSYHPLISSAMWETILTGKMAYEHGITSLLKVDTITQKVSLRARAKKYHANLFDQLQEGGSKIALVGWAMNHTPSNSSAINVSRGFIRSKLLKQKEATHNWPYQDNAIANISDELQSPIAKLRIHPQELNQKDLDELLSMELGDLTGEQSYILKDIFSNLLSTLAIVDFISDRCDIQFCAVFFDFIDKIHYNFEQNRLFKSVDQRNLIVERSYAIIDSIIGTLLQNFDPENSIILSECGSSQRKIRLTKKNIGANINSSDLQNGVAIFNGLGIKKDHTAGLYNPLDILGQIANLAGLNSSTENIPRDDTESSDYVRDLITMLENGKSQIVLNNIVNSSFWCALNLLENKKYDIAQELLEKVLLKRSGNQSILKLLQYVYQKKKIPLTKNLVDGDLLHTEVNSLLIKAKTALSNNQRDKALEYLIQAETKSDDHPKFLHNIYDIYWKASDLTGASRIAKKILELDQDDYSAWNKKARVERKDSRLDEAMESLNTSLYIKNHQPIVYFLQSEIAIHQQNFVDAKRYIDNAILQNPQNRRFRIAALKNQEQLKLSQQEILTHRRVFEDGLKGEISILTTFDFNMVQESIKSLQDQETKNTWLTAMKVLSQVNSRNTMVKISEAYKHYLLRPKQLSMLPIEFRYKISVIAPDRDLFKARSMKRLKEEELPDLDGVYNKRMKMMDDLADGPLKALPHLHFKHHREMELATVLEQLLK